MPRRHPEPALSPAELAALARRHADLVRAGDASLAGSVALVRRHQVVGGDLLETTRHDAQLRWAS